MSTNNDMPGAGFTGVIYEFRVRGTSIIEGWPNYDYTFRSPNRAEAAGNAYETVQSASFQGAVNEVLISHRRVRFDQWDTEWTTDEFNTWVAAQAAEATHLPV